MQIPKIDSILEYQEKENRLKEINKLLESMSQKDDIDLAKVIELRDEAKEIATSLKSYIKATLEPKK